MATLYVSEFRAITGLDEGPGTMAKQPPMQEQNLAITATASISAAFHTATRFVRLHTDAICSVLFVAPNATTTNAVTTNARLAAGQTEYFGVPQGIGYKVSVISNT